ncbi:ROK family transcriptional regulator [Microbacterium sp. 179-I 3D4 NHS]|uniref:ROK family transcriptional regulator n=1 Tax=Microbacterium sp. 179-I 3D4 NHS TaxID=3142381 RepID=UPI0039A074BF
MNPHVGDGQALRPSGARAHNRLLVLRMLLRAPGISRADVARITGLSRITVSHVVTELMDEGLLIEIGARESTGRRGKPATLLRANPRAYAVVAADLSQLDKFRAALVGFDGEVLSTAEVDSRDMTGDAAIDAVMNLIALQLSRADVPVRGVGIGTPGVVDEEGRVLEAFNLRWRDVPLAQLVSTRFGLPTYVENDANSAISSEFRSSADADAVLIRLGTGLGGAVMLNGVIIRGTNHASGEFGRVRLAEGSDETVESAAATELDRILASTGEERIDAHRALGTVIGRAIAPAVGMLDIADVIIAGPDRVDLGLVIDAVAETTGRMLSVGPYRPTLQVRRATSGDDIVISGVAAQVLAQRLVEFERLGENA